MFWCGDLNYRIDLPGSLAKDAINKTEWNKLHRHEQLIKQKKLGKVSSFVCVCVCVCVTVCICVYMFMYVCV